MKIKIWSDYACPFCYIGEKAATYKTKLLEEIFIELADADYKMKTGRAGIEILERIVIKLCSR